MNYDVEELRNSLDGEQIKTILSSYDISPINENENYIIFPTCCHNLIGGSAKLYYYFNSHLFTCYTQCNDSFDIFELIIKIEKLRGNNISLRDSIKKCGINNFEIEESKELIDEKKSLDYLNRVYTTQPIKINTLKEVNNQALKKYIFNIEYLKP